MVSDQDICKAVVENPRPDLACRRLVKMANENGGEDNVTAVVIRIVDETQRARLAFAATQEMPSIPPTERANSDAPPSQPGPESAPDDSTADDD
jgi:serine/threonine protein phosphatase PrpC